MEITAGDICETVSIVTVREGEFLESEVICELRIGTLVEILETGQRQLRRAKVHVMPDITGWISVKTRLNEPLITKIDLNSDASFEVGCEYEVMSLLTLRAGESLDSEFLRDLRPGIVVKLQEIGQLNKRRCKVVTMTGEANDLEGWISFTTRMGDLLVDKVQRGGERGTLAGRGVNMGTQREFIRLLLESARLGDLQAVKELVENTAGGRPNLDCSDIRGKTALIYAAAFGNSRVVEYLLQQPGVDVNGKDDSQKSALHHAAKRARTIRGPGVSDGTQKGIVEALISAGAWIEARDHNGCTSLMFAIANGDEGVTNVLLDAGAAVNAKDFEGHTPLDYAENFGYEDLGHLLRLRGAEHSDGVREEQEEDYEELGHLLRLHGTPHSDGVRGEQEEEEQVYEYIDYADENLMLYYEEDGYDSDCSTATPTSDISDLDVSSIDSQED